MRCVKLVSGARQSRALITQNPTNYELYLVSIIGDISLVVVINPVVLLILLILSIVVLTLLVHDEMCICIL